MSKKKKRKKNHKNDDLVVYYIGGNMRVNSSRLPPEAMALGQVEKCCICNEGTIVSKVSFKNVSTACFDAGRICKVLCDQCKHKVKLDHAIPVSAPLDPDVKKVIDKHNKAEFQRAQRDNLEMMKRLARKGKISSDVYEVNMYHDDDCDILSQRGPCNCTPTIGKPKPLLDPSGN